MDRHRRRVLAAIEPLRSTVVDRYGATAGAGAVRMYPPPFLQAANAVSDAANKTKTRIVRMNRIR